MLRLVSAALASQASAQAEATATLRVLSGAVASPKAWRDASAHRKRTVRVKDEAGKTLVVHLIEFE